MSNKALVTVQILDALGNPIPKIHYQVKNQKTDQHVVKGITNSKGCFYEIQRDKGTVLDVYVKGLFDNGLTKVKSFTISKDRMLVKVLSPKLLIDLKTLENNGKQGGYTRKPHIVQKGDTLTSIAQQYDSTVRALESLNTLKNINKLSIGQVIKLPFYTPATGNNISQDRKPQPLKKQIESTKSKKNTPKKDDEKKAGQSLESSLGDYKNKALEQLNEWYEDGKKALSEAVKIEMKEDRSKDSGTPKSDVLNLCMSSPQCITSGQSELIREINIRLAGFGGALPTDKFTPLTEACIKQFQRDYMGAPETGKICGSLIQALDNFNQKYPIQKYMKDIVCPCNKYGGGKQCKGFGAGRKKQYKTLAVEAPGMHRSTMWILKAVHFYLEKEQQLNVKIIGISSGYRCIENNEGHNNSKVHRVTVNHMSGAALDILLSDNNKLDAVRDNIFIKYMNAAKIGTRASNKIFLESAAQLATNWVHFDILWYENIDPMRKEYYGDTVEKIIMGSLINNFGKNNPSILSCAGMQIKHDKMSDGDVNPIDKNIRAFLDTIAKSEGTYDLGDKGYNVMVTGKLFKEYADHPFTHSDKALHVSGSLYSTASGRYQIMRVNWYGTKENPELGLKYQLGLKNFNPESQDIAAINLLKRRKAYELIKAGKIKTAFSITSLNKEWASFPGAGYNQQEHKISKILKWYQDFGGKLND